MKLRLLWLLVAFAMFTPALAATDEVAAPKVVYVLPIRDEVATPLVYLVRRGVKEAMEAHADILVLDMETNGGRVDQTEKIIEILNQFSGQTVTYVNRKAFSAGAFISVATQRIFMAPQSVIGAAAPIMLLPGTGPQEMPQTVEAKMTSGIRALVRTSAEKNGHNVEVIEAMIDKTRELKIDGKMLNEKGQILTLTNKQAEEEYGQPPRPLLSAGTVDSLDALLERLAGPHHKRHDITPTGVERLGSWINAISPLLLIIGIVGLYIEFKTPGFGLPGILGLVAFGLYFLGGYVAGLSGLEWMAVFVIGVILVIVEIFFVPGTVLLGVAGAALMLLALIMAMVDVYPGMPAIPSLPQLRLPLQNFVIAACGSTVAVVLLSFWLPKTRVYGSLVSQTASGVQSTENRAALQESLTGQVGVALSTLRPGGKAQFGERVLDAISQGEMIDKGQRVRIVAFSGHEAVVEIMEG